MQTSTLVQASARAKGETVVITLQGRFGCDAHREFSASCDIALGDRQAKRIKIDFAGVAQMDNCALGMLLLLRQQAAALGKTVCLSNSFGEVRRLLAIASFDKVFEMV